VKFEAKMVY